MHTVMLTLQIIGLYVDCRLQCSAALFYGVTEGHIKSDAGHKGNMRLPAHGWWGIQACLVCFATR